MPEPAMLDYFYGDEAEQYTFYRIPKVLFTDPSYRRISSDAKILYGLMLDGMGLSVRNGWLDDCNRVFIYFTLEDALEYLCCGHTNRISSRNATIHLKISKWYLKIPILLSSHRKHGTPFNG